MSPTPTFGDKRQAPILPHRPMCPVFDDPFAVGLQEIHAIPLIRLRQGSKPITDTFGNPHIPTHFYDNEPSSFLLRPRVAINPLARAPLLTVPAPLVPSPRTSLTPLDTLHLQDADSLFTGLNHFHPHFNSPFCCLVSALVSPLQGPSVDHVHTLNYLTDRAQPIKLH